LVLLGVAFAVANLWVTAVRSTIPLELQGIVKEKLRLPEKEVGVDDVYLVTLDSGRSVQVDGPVFEALTLNRAVSKRAWSRTMESDGRAVILNWSPDFRGMAYGMPVVAALIVLHGFLIYQISVKQDAVVKE
jgi:hypothetical protein